MFSITTRCKRQPLWFRRRAWSRIKSENQKPLCHGTITPPEIIHRAAPQTLQPFAKFWLTPQNKSYFSFFCTVPHRDTSRDAVFPFWQASFVQQSLSPSVICHTEIQAVESFNKSLTFPYAAHQIFTTIWSFVTFWSSNIWIHAHQQPGTRFPHPMQSS